LYLVRTARMAWILSMSRSAADTSTSVTTSVRSASPMMQPARLRHLALEPSWSVGVIASNQARAASSTSSCYLAYARV
jgi:hypothetical protein